MRFIGAKTLRLSMRWLRSRMVNHGLILGYHRIADEPDDPYGMCVSPHHFAHHLELLRRFAHPISLAEMVQSLRQRKLPPRAVAITFDDGYVDNLQHAQPLLEHYQIPATVFVVSGGMGEVFWWDELSEWVYTSPVLPDMTVPSPVNEFAAGKASVHALTRSQRQKILACLYQQLMPLQIEERQAVLASLQAQYALREGNQTSGLRWRRSLTNSELRELANQSCIEIGAHTVSHPMLTALPLTAQMAEIRSSKTELENILARPVTCFSYPYGAVDNTTQEFVQAAGFEYACTSNNDIVHPGSRLYELPRFWTPDWDGETFTRWLQRWL